MAQGGAHEDRSDEALAASARRNPDDMAELYRRYVATVFQFAYRRTGERASAEDLTSQIFLTMVARIDRFNGGSFRAWLFTLARNAAIDRYRALKPSFPLDPEFDVPDESSDPEKFAIIRDEQRTVRELLGRLSPDQRSVVELHLAGLNAPEIGQVLGKRSDAIRALQSRALASLRSMVKANEEIWSGR